MREVEQRLSEVRGARGRVRARRSSQAERAEVEAGDILFALAQARWAYDEHEAARTAVGEAIAACVDGGDVARETEVRRWLADRDDAGR
jgi:hypothetical protein